MLPAWLQVLDIEVAMVLAVQLRLRCKLPRLAPDYLQPCAWLFDAHDVLLLQCILLQHGAPSSTARTADAE